MPKLKLTKNNIDRLDFTPKGQVDYWDTELSGFDRIKKIKVRLPTIEAAQYDAAFYDILELAHIAGPAV